MTIDQPIKESLRAFLDTIYDAGVGARDAYEKVVRSARIITRTADDAKDVIRYFRDTEYLLTISVENQQAKYVNRRYACVISALSERQLAQKMRNGGMSVPDVTLYLDGSGRPMEVLSASVGGS